MSSPRPGMPGATRACPHCKETILESARVCPGCKHHLRFEPTEPGAGSGGFVPLRVEGEIRHPAEAPPWEYSVVVAIHNDRGEEIARRVVGVGALSSSEVRTFTLSVDAAPVAGKTTAKPSLGIARIIGRAADE